MSLCMSLLQRSVCDCNKRILYCIVLNQLHWLPVRQRAIYKTAVLTHKFPVTGQPEHLSVLDYTPSVWPSHQLWSSDRRQLLSQAADNTVFASRAFSSTAPRIWNSLPITVRTAPSSDTKRLICSPTTPPSTNCYHPRLRFEPVLTYSTLQILTTYLLNWPVQAAVETRIVYNNIQKKTFKNWWACKSNSNTCP